MVRAYYPQQAQRTILVNSNYSPQGQPPSEVLLAPIMEYEDFVSMAYEAENWLNAAFQQRIPLTINAGQVPSTQTDFQLLINDTYPDLIGEVEAELRFAGSDNIQLDYEIQKFDSGTGELIAWTKKPSVSDSDIVNIYFDNPGAIDEQDSGEVWDSNYAMVLHLQNSFLDSTSNGNDATNNGTTDIAGKIGQARNFDGIDDFLQIADSSSLQPIKVTISAWIQSSQTADGAIISKSTTDNPKQTYKMIRDSASLAKFAVLTVDSSNPLNLLGTVSLSTTLFDYITMTFDGVTMRNYVNGVLDNTVGKTGDLDYTLGQDLILGMKTAAAFDIFDGIIDEPRVSPLVLSDDRILTEFNNQNDTSTFYSTGAVESVPSLVSMRYES